MLELMLELSSVPAFLEYITGGKQYESRAGKKVS